MIVKETKNPEEIKAVLCHPEIYDCITDDTCPHSDGFEPPIDDGHEYIAGYHDGEVFAIMVYHYVDGCLYTHIQVLPEHRKDRALNFARMALDHGIAKNEPIYAQIPDCYPNVLAFAKRFGFEITGRVEGEYLKNGEYVGVNVLRCDHGVR